MHFLELNFEYLVVMMRLILIISTKQAYVWGFDIRTWQKHLNPLTWPEILRQFALSAGFGPQLKKKSTERGGLNDSEVCLHNLPVIVIIQFLHACKDNVQAPKMIVLNPLIPFWGLEFLFKTVNLYRVNPHYYVCNSCKFRSLWL